MENQKVGSATSRRTKQKQKNECKTPPQYVVKTRGYEETFATSEDAKKQYDVLKKRSVKNQEKIKIQLTEVDAKGGKKTLESVSIGDDFFK